MHEKLVTKHHLSKEEADILLNNVCIPDDDIGWTKLVIGKAENPLVNPFRGVV